MNTSLMVEGGRPLKGTLQAAGAKNAMTKLLVASLLSDQPCVFENVPWIGDVETTVALIQELGAEVTWDREGGILEVQTRGLRTTYVPQSFSGANRIPILLIGALLGRTEQDIIVPTVGGDAIGTRPVNFHLDALRQMGAEIEYREMKREGAYLARALRGLHGAHIRLPFPSVGATENILLAASRARSSTLIEGAAVEPEILDLIFFLQKLGVSIHFEGDRSIRIHPLLRARPVHHKVLGDRAECASFACAALATGGEVEMLGAPVQAMAGFFAMLRQLGVEVELGADRFSVRAPDGLRGSLHIETGVYPGFLTDQQQPFVAMLTQCQGRSVIHETLYENRFGYVETLQSMGAEISLFKECLGAPCRYHLQGHEHSAVIHGKTPLQGRDIEIPDLRAGFAYVMAALLAPERSTVRGAHFLDRGYAQIVERLQALGANITRVDETEPSPSSLQGRELCLGGMPL